MSVRILGLPAGLSPAVNRVVLAHLQDKSAHSDIATELAVAVKPLGDVQLFCPDWNAYRHVAVATGNVVFGFAIGTNLVAFRLDPSRRERALASGGSAYPACGPEWVSFLLFRDDWPKADLPFWALKAYAYARTPL